MFGAGGSIEYCLFAQETAMSNLKAEVQSMIEGLPEDTSLEDIQYHLYVLEKVKRGIERAETESAISNEEAKARLGKWLAA